MLRHFLPNSKKTTSFKSNFLTDYHFYNNIYPYKAIICSDIVHVINNNTNKYLNIVIYFPGLFHIGTIHKVPITSYVISLIIKIKK